MDKIETTKEELAAAFTEWQRRYNEDPSNFSIHIKDDQNYGQGAADYLINLLEKK